jgi:hypothetical protein
MALDYKTFSRALGKWVSGKKKPDISKSTGKVGSPVKMKKVTKSPVRTDVSRKETTFTGVYFRYKSGGMKPWQALMVVAGQHISLGYFDTDRLAAIAYDKKAIQLGRPTNILKPRLSA